jgi:hypothetical protein
MDLPRPSERTYGELGKHVNRECVALRLNPRWSARLMPTRSRQVWVGMDNQSSDRTRSSNAGQHINAYRHRARQEVSLEMVVTGIRISGAPDLGRCRSIPRHLP